MADSYLWMDNLTYVNVFRPATKKYTQITENHHNIVKRRHALMFVHQFSLFVSFCLHHEYKIYPRERLVSVIIKWLARRKGRIVR